ncbi:MAG: alkyldihydroxyacetonephosphate synthase, partial [Actinomycetota bacterium]|nr:alkyldihydroxyacetonephosphate synthase [Actinomycetota bacterium]
FGGEPADPIPPPTMDEIDLRAARIAPPAALASVCTDDPFERASHTYGKSFRDVWRALHRDFSCPPDLVAIPRTEADIVALLDWCSDQRIAAVPYGGGSSVVGGVECDVGDEYRGAVSIDMRALDRVLEIDRVSRAARIQAGVYGPALEDQLRPHGLTLRHYPQSFEFSTLGGWLATRSGGHYATLHTHIDDFVESIRAMTPRGEWESRRLPGSGAGPSPDRTLLGSEGILGVITEAWMRLQDRPTFRASATARFPTFERASEAARAISQSGLYPANCRLLDATEAGLTGADDSGTALLLLAFESADHPLGPWINRAVECARDHGGEVADDQISVRDGRTGSEGEGARDGAAGSWRNAFIRAPYTRDALVGLGAISETFETACTWDAFPALHEGITSAVLDTAEAAGAWPAVVTCRFTHVYPDGPAPYFTVLARGTEPEQLAQWEAIKAAAGAALTKHGGTITHHHAVGRDHRRWYDRQRPEPFAAALRAAKAAVDPAGILNPGVIVDPADAIDSPRPAPGTGPA